MTHATPAPKGVSAEENEGAAPLTQATVATHLWFDGPAGDAAAFYVSLFDDAEVTRVNHWGKGGPAEPGTVMSASFRLKGQRFVALNGGPHFKLTEAVSIMVVCESQAELDRAWARLLDGGTGQRCGWLKDRFGLCWQLVPAGLERLLTDPDPERSARAMKAMLGMVKLDIEALRRAADGA